MATLVRTANHANQEPSAEERAFEVLTRAFSADPAARWLFPHWHHFERYFPDLMRALGGKAFSHNTALCIDGVAAALWLPPGVHPDDQAVSAVLRASLSKAERETAFALVAAMERHRPAEPHWYLAAIGVDSLHQGLGLGSALLRRGLQVCDRQRMPAYLEATSAGSRRLYERAGFVAVGTIQVGLSPEIHPMWREPRAAVAGRTLVAAGSDW